MENIDIQDIVDKTFGDFKVVKYVGVRMFASDKKHIYEVVCRDCGTYYQRSRSNIRRSNGCKCRKCKQDVIANQIADIRRNSDKANLTNVTTKVKHYNVGKNHNSYMHTVRCMVEKQDYKLLQFTCTDNQPQPVCIELANELNEVLSYGKEAFYKWYENL